MLVEAWVVQPVTNSKTLETKHCKVRGAIQMNGILSLYRNENVEIEFHLVDGVPIELERIEHGITVVEYGRKKGYMRIVATLEDFFECQEHIKTWGGATLIKEEVDDD